MTSSEVTRLLMRWSDGDEAALEPLLNAVYDELRRLAGAYLRKERADHTLETSALVHEAYLRLVDQQQVRWCNRHHFFGIAAQAMRRILVDHARHHHCARRGGDQRRLSLDPGLLPLEQAPELVALEDALRDLAAMDPEAAKVVELRYFAGLSGEETAAVLNLSVRTVSRRWRLARSWLYQALGGAPPRRTAHVS